MEAKAQQFEIQPYIVLDGSDACADLETALNARFAQGYRVVDVIPASAPTSTGFTFDVAKVILFREPRQSEIVGTGEYKDKQERKVKVELSLEEIELLKNLSGDCRIVGDSLVAGIVQVGKVTKTVAQHMYDLGYIDAAKKLTVKGRTKAEEYIS